jgi:hypothetical protein
VHFVVVGALEKNFEIVCCFSSGSLEGSNAEVLSLFNLRVSSLKRGEDACLSRLILGE